MNVDSECDHESRWVPIRVLLTADWLTKLGGSDQLSPSAKAAVARLALDPRMKMVWRVILQRDSSSGFRYPVNPKALNPYYKAIEGIDKRIAFLEQFDDERSAAELNTMRLLRESATEHLNVRAARIEKMTSVQRQKRAGPYLLTAATAAFQYAGMLTPSDVKQTLEFLEEKIVDLRDLVQLTKSFELSGAERELREWAFSVQQVEKTPFYAKRSSRDDRLRAFVIALGLKTKELFGARLSGVIATLANVSFSRQDVTDLEVRDMIRNNNKRNATKRHI